GLLSHREHTGVVHQAIKQHDTRVDVSLVLAETVYRDGRNLPIFRPPQAEDVIVHTTGNIGLQLCFPALVERTAAGPTTGSGELSLKGQSIRLIRLAQEIKNRDDDARTFTQVLLEVVDCSECECHCMRVPVVCSLVSTMRLRATAT